ncbi:hypothetical protein [Phocaeicola vulgatus]|uniref:hypothetical protein n=1 Tax=Phocaeicola vulgatus TaxID=821 RepID=UPI0021658C78|nr:hypothetical protein [Phocaeicola vulgatus]MCS2730115.1 hypothetical protein [Phocaeicola vulgatus]
MGLIDIKNISGDIRFSTDFNVGSIGRYSLGKEDYITLPFNVLTPINFKMGDYVDLSGILDESLGGKFAKIYEIVDLPTPTYDQSTGGYNYELRLDAYYWKWKNKKFKYMPEVAGQEASWNLTASLDMQLGVFLRNLQALGYKYRGNDFDFSIDSSVENSAKLMSYENINLLDALTNMAETWNCEWWVEDNIIRFGRCENGDAVRIELGVEAQEMPRSESQGTYATRVYAFGSTRNIPSNYRPVDETVVVNGIVQKRLMLPEGTPYIDAYRYKDGKRVYIGEEGYDIGTEMPQEEAIEDIIFLDEVYPRTECVVGTVGSYTSTIEDEETQETVTQTFYYVTDTSGLVFDESYIIDGEELRLVFQSGLLNGMDFGVTFHKAGTSLGSVTLESDVYEIVANDNYGRTLPDETLKPTTGDKFILYGWDSTKITDLGLVSNAEQELRDKTVDCVKKMMVDDGTYNTTLASSWVKENMISRTFDIGQRIELVNKSFFETSRISRVIGLEIKLDLPYDAPVYTIGESTAYSRIGELENKVDNLTYKGQTYTNGGGKGVYIIRTNDSTAPSNSNVFSALRSLAMFLRKDISDTANGLITFLKGIIVKSYLKIGEFITGVSGGYIDEKGNLEMESGVFRKRLFVPEIAYNRTTYFKGRMVNSPGGGCTVLSYVDNGDGTYTITPDLTDADGLSQFVDDILTTYFVTKNSEGKLNGFEEMKFRVTAADYTAKKFTVIPRPGHSDWKPAEQMVLAQTGNFTDPERQTYILIDSVNGNNCITFFDNANTWDPEPAQMPAWFGKKKGMTVAGINADNYSAVLQNIIMTGLIFQVDEITGQTVRVPLDKGEWVAGKYAYYDRVSHNGALWLCVDDNGTTTEPSDDNPAWLKQVAEGQKGDPGLSVVGGGHWESSKTPYKANTMVTLANCVFISKVETSNPPIRILRVKSGNFLRKKDGGYILAGKSADWEVNEDWDMLLDGRELKGESITFLGEFATAPANPKNGDSYRNTTDRATYIYQDGRWQLMISDGKDGKGYEYIYTRGNIIDNTPEKPDSQQKDGYIPEGWTDNYLGTDADHQVEWGCTRFKENGVWSEFSDPAVVHRWSKDGENAIMADFDNEMVNAALTSDGKVVSSQTWNTTVSMWYGTEKLTLDSITCTPDTNLLCATDKNTGVVTISVSAGATLAATNTVKITIRATKNGQQYSRDLSFTVAGVRGGADGSDAVLYSIIVSATSVSKDKNGNYSVSSVSCYRQKSVGGVISTTTDGTLKYSIDGGTETTINNNTAISSGNFTKTLKFIFYVNDQIVDVETVPMLSDGKDGADGESITAAGHWESANTPYAKNSTVSFAGGSYLSKVKTSNPPIRIARFKNGSYRRKKDGGYILAGRSANRTVHADWQEMVAPVGPSASYWLDSPVSVINFTSTGTPSPSGFLVTCKQNVAGNVSTCSTLYLAARKYNGSWLAHVGATLSNQISVPATAGYTQFAVRAYQSASDANAWNNNFVAEKGVGVANDGAIGATGATGASPRDMGVFQSGTSYVWNASYRDKIIYKFNGVYYNFLVRNYGASVTAAPTSVNGDSNWEAMQKFVNIATDTLFATGANICGFMFTYKGMDANGIPFGDIKSQKSTNGVPNLILNSESGYIHGINMDIEGGRIGPFSIASGMLSSKILYENETNKYVGFNLSAGQIEFYNERTFANVRIGGNTQFVTIEGIAYDAGIDIQSPNPMIGMHIKTPSIPLFVEGGNIFLHPNNNSYVSLHGIVGNWRNISDSTSLNNNDDNVMFINTGNIEVTLPPDVPGHTIYFKRMSGGVRLTGGRILPAPGGQEVSYIDLDFASGFIKCMGNYWVMFYCG